MKKTSTELLLESMSLMLDGYGRSVPDLMNEAKKLEKEIREQLEEMRAERGVEAPAMEDRMVEKPTYVAVEAMTAVAINRLICSGIQCLLRVATENGLESIEVMEVDEERDGRLMAQVRMMVSRAGLGMEEVLTMMVVYRDMLRLVPRR